MPGFKFDEPQLKEQQTKKYSAPSEGGGFHQFIPPSDTPSFFDKKFIKSSIKGLNEILEGKGYPPGTVISLVSVPKAGKTTLAIQEAIKMSLRGDDILYMYNESTQDEFMRIVDKHREDLMIDRKLLINPHLTFMDRHRKSPGSAGYREIESFVENVIINPIRGWLEKHENPKLIVIDSLTKFIRQYPAQSFVFAQAMMYDLKDMFYKNHKYPVVLCINQKASTFDKRDDESVLGGLGIVHDMDGSFVIRTETVNKWTADETGLEIGSKMRLFRIEDIRLSNADTRERIFLREKQTSGALELVIGETLEELNKHGPNIWKKKKEGF